MKWVITIILILGAAIPLAAQPQIDRQLAEQYFQNGDFEKAAIYYEKLYGDTRLPLFFDRYVACLTRLEQFDEAQKLLKKERKKNPNNYTLALRLGQVYNLQKNRPAAEKEWDRAIRGLKSNQNDILQVAREFTKMGEYAFALKTYEQGKKLVDNFYVFNYEIAEVYGLMGRNEEMIDLYLELIEQNPAYLQNVQNMLARNIDFEDDIERVEILRTRLLKKVQQSSDNALFSEMLIWLFLQRQDYFGAFVQTKALDRRLQEDGRRVITLARVARKNKANDAALAAYEYVTQKGPDFFYYYDARKEWLATRKQLLDETFTTPEADYLTLRDQYVEALPELEKKTSTAATVRELAEIEALRLDQVDSAIIRLETQLEQPRLDKSDKALTQIDLGDYLLIAGRIWDAGILYMKAEKAFKYDEIGERAKYKATKVYYFTGEFEFARGQLDVLKSSTSRLIANDAMYLSNLILDNTGLDSNEVPMRMFARAELLTIQHKYTEALSALDSISTGYPDHGLNDDVLFQRYKLFFQARDFEKAANALEGIVSNYGDDILGDDAVFKLAELNEQYLNNPSPAKELYEKILFEYPGSLYVVEARTRFRTLRGDTIN